MKRDATSTLVWHIIGLNIRKIRAHQKQSQTKFAEMVGVSRSYLNQIEKGKQNASVEILIKIADGLDVPLPDLFKGLEGHAPGRLPRNSTYSAIEFPE